MRRLADLTNRAAILVILAAFVLLSPAPPAHAESERTKVVVIATHRFITDMPRGYTPGHLRALLGRVRPDVIGAEAASNVPHSWQNAPLDCRWVTKPWADENGVDIVPVGWSDPQYPSRLESMFRELRGVGTAAEYKRVEKEFQQRSARIGSTLADLNSKASRDNWRTYHRRLHELYGRATPWEEWNEKIVSNVLRLCAEHPGKRVAIVFSAAHCYFISDRLAEAPGINLVPTDHYLPVSEGEARAKTLPIDHLRALRLLNLQDYGSLPGAALDRLEEHLEAAAEEPEFRNDCRLFRGKLLLHRGRPGDATDEFARAAELDQEKVAVFDGKTPLAETARVWCGVAHKMAGNKRKARRLLREVVEDTSATRNTRLWAQQEMKSLSK